MTAPPGAPRPREMSDLSLKVRPTVRPISLRRGATALLPRNPVTSAHGEKAQSACCCRTLDRRNFKADTGKSSVQNTLHDFCYWP